jgi:hypothetical protein
VAKANQEHRVPTLEREIANLRSCLWRCAEIAGADLSGLGGPSDGAFKPPEAVQAVRDLREEYEGVDKPDATSEQGGGQSGS